MVRKIKKAAVIGSGIMGGGIAAILAGAGVDVLLLDIVPFDLKDEEKNDKKARNRIVTAGLEAATKAKPPLFYSKADVARISTGNLEDDFDKLADCDWIIEVVVENLKIKQQLFARIDKVRKPDTIVSSNTSGIPLKAMSEGLSQGFKENFLGTHFFNPVRYMHLLEIIPGELTKKDVLDFIADFGERMLGKGIVWAKDTPNFIGNRIGIHGIGKTMQVMLADGLTIPEVDEIFGAPLGRPKTAIFKTSDLVGLDTMTHVSQNTYDMCPNDEERDVFAVPAFVKTMVEKKLLGNKTKAGFYKTDITPEWKKVRKVIDPATGEYVEYGKAEFESLAAAKKAATLPEKIKAVINGTDKAAKFAWKVMAGQLIYAANRIPEISDTVVEIDNAMKWGYNFTFGPFETWDAIGVEESVKRMEADGMKVPENVKKMLASGAKSFYKLEKGKKMFFDFASGKYVSVKTSPKALDLQSYKAENKVVLTTPSCSLIDIGDGVFCLEFHAKMNAINKEMVEFMNQAGEYVDKNGLGMVIGNQAGGMPGAFSAGGDLAYMLSLAKAGKFSEIDDFIKQVHKGIMGTRYAKYPVVAAPYGLTLGGGCEVCLAADRIVAHTDLFMGLVEIGAGIVPGGCGMINLWRRFVESKPESAKITDLGAFFLPVFMAVAQAKVSNSAANARANGFLRPTDRIVMNRDNLIGEAKKEVLKMLDDGYAPPLKTKIPVLGREALGMVWAELLNMKGGGYIPPHMETISKRIAICLSGGDVPSGTAVSEEHLMTLEREAFVDLWKTENSQKMAEHIMKTGKPLIM
ncbi:MAG TPA: 3-hydroxyacyl-CoA dehydrogenase/enoyl-CoA hydratase family protein [Deltaproteobacteria bacterium]|nr:3-hydroxyacyl-CoA dehydrogenase/enoyl-CoA hydratase family protein [Deltaproteobacteria bacterium]HOI06223.1 3-hydroxyacyl-CoA dehydrogenase/enoyl-CoA hydratase family protein [Deltaproteobacteria bacterium]